MKGVVFTEFLEMVEDKFSIETAEDMLEQSELASGGIYTAVGTYDHAELLRMVTRLGTLSGIPVPGLVQAFGKHLFARFTMAYPSFFAGVNSSFDFLSQVDDHVHVEVRKLYPDAELPHFEVRRLGTDRLEMIYRSTRPFADLAEGLIIGCVAHFGEEIALKREGLADGTNGVRFLLTCSSEVLACST